MYMKKYQNLVHALILFLFIVNTFIVWIKHAHSTFFQIQVKTVLSLPSPESDVSANMHNQKNAFWIDLLEFHDKI